MTDRGCTFGLEHGPCYDTPSVAVWRYVGSKRKVWTCAKHDEQMDKRTRQHKVRSHYRRTRIASGNESVSTSGTGTDATTAPTAATGTPSAPAATATSRSKA